MLVSPCFPECNTANGMESHCRKFDKHCEIQSSIDVGHAILRRPFTHHSCRWYVKMKSVHQFVLSFSQTIQSCLTTSRETRAHDHYCDYRWPLFLLFLLLVFLSLLLLLALVCYFQPLTFHYYRKGLFSIPMGSSRWRRNNWKQNKKSKWSANY